MTETEKKAKRIVAAIEADFTDRRGLRREWEQIDAETQNEIRAEWTKIVLKVLGT